MTVEIFFFVDEALLLTHKVRHSDNLNNILKIFTANFLTD